MATRKTDVQIYLFSEIFYDRQEVHKYLYSEIFLYFC